MIHRTALGIVLMLLFLLTACSQQADSPTELSSSGDTATPQAAPAPDDADSAVALDELPRNPDGYVDLQVDQLQALLQDEAVTLVNVHVPYEGELPATDLFIPYDQIQNQTADLPDKDAPIVLYCRSGAMSTQAANVLVELGYTRVYELDGGFNAWQAVGYELLHNQ